MKYMWVSFYKDQIILCYVFIIRVTIGLKKLICLTHSQLAMMNTFYRDKMV